MEEIDEYYTCRICLDDELRRCDVIAPCSCAGSSKWVHRACLDQWRTTREDRAFSRCTECLADYELIPRPEYEAPEMQTKRRRKYIALMVRDIGGMLAVTQAVIIAMAFLVYACDNHEKHLITQAHMLAYPRIFYYLTGLIISSAIAGIFGTYPSCPPCHPILPLSLFLAIARILTTSSLFFLLFSPSLLTLPYPTLTYLHLHLHLHLSIQAP